MRQMRFHAMAEAVGDVMQFGGDRGGIAGAAIDVGGHQAGHGRHLDAADMGIAGAGDVAGRLKPTIRALIIMDMEQDHLHHGSPDGKPIA